MERREECLGDGVEEAVGLGSADPALHSPAMWFCLVPSVLEREVLRDFSLRYQPFLQDKRDSIPAVPALGGNEELGKANSEWRHKIGGEMSSAPCA